MHQNPRLQLKTRHEDGNSLAVRLTSLMAGESMHTTEQQGLGGTEALGGHY